MGQTVCGFIGSAGDVNAAALCSMQLCASSRRRGQDGRDMRRRRGETTQCVKQLRRGHPRLLGRGLQAIRELQTQARRMRHVRRHLSTASAADGSIPQLCDAACNASHPVTGASTCPITHPSKRLRAVRRTRWSVARDGGALFACGAAGDTGRRMRRGTQVCIAPAASGACTFAPAGHPPAEH